MKKLYFVRHGLSEMNKAGLRSGRTDTPLTPEGIEQAKLAGAKAKNLQIDLVISSPLSRAHHTAKVIAAEIGYPEDKILLDEAVIERDFGALEGAVYVSGEPLEGVENIETAEAIIARAERALARLQQLPHDNILVVSHGSFGRALRHHTNPDTPFQDVAQPHHRLKNATIIELL
jgi:uncharacterized phosphatase